MCEDDETVTSQLFQILHACGYSISLRTNLQPHGVLYKQQLHVFHYDAIAVVKFHHHPRCYDGDLLSFHGVPSNLATFSVQCYIDFLLAATVWYSTTLYIFSHLPHLHLLLLFLLLLFLPFLILPLLLQVVLLILLFLIFSSFSFSFSSSSSSCSSFSVQTG